MPNEFDFDTHFLENYNTKLHPENEKRFQAWLAVEGQKRGKDMSKDTQDYDLRGYWLNGGTNEDPSGRGHFPDTYKKPNHPTFSDQSIYHGTPSPYGGNFQGGQWAPDGATFTPSQQMLQTTHPLPFLLDYMRKIEPDTQVLLPNQQGY